VPLAGKIRGVQRRNLVRHLRARLWSLRLLRLGFWLFEG